MEKVPEDPEFRSVFRIFPERNSGMCSRKFPEQRSGNREIFRKQCHVHRHPHSPLHFSVTLNYLCRRRLSYSYYFVFRIFPERNSGMRSGKFPEQCSGNREIFRKQCHVHRHPHCTSVLR